jgi:hypothetical protein
VSGYEVVTVQQQATIPAGNALGGFAAFCPLGKKVLGGGGSSLGGAAIVLKESLPIANTGWEVMVANESAVPVMTTVTAYAVCAFVS